MGIVRALRSFRLTQSINSLRTIVFCATSMIPLVVPQLTLFCSVYYGFAVIGMALFAGDTTKSVDAGGPGRWDTEPWISTYYGEATRGGNFYYDLNFDNLGQSFVTLFVCMVQNNWYVVVDGFVQTNNEWVKLYFFSFNIIVVLVMVNIFVAVLLSLYDILLPHSDGGRTVSPAVEAEFKALESRLLCTTFHKSWRVKKILKDNSILFQNNGSSESLASDLQSKEQGELRQTRTILECSPIPIFIQSTAGLFTFCNGHYARLFNKTPDEVMDKHEEDGPLKMQRVEWRKHVLAAGTQCECREKIRDHTGKMRQFIATSRPIELLRGGVGTITYLQELRDTEYLEGLQREWAVRDVRVTLMRIAKGQMGMYIEQWRVNLKFDGDIKETPSPLRDYAIDDDEDSNGQVKLDELHDLSNEDGNPSQMNIDDQLINV